MSRLQAGSQGVDSVYNLKVASSVAFAALKTMHSLNDKDLAFFWDRSSVASGWAGRELFRLLGEAWA